MLKILHSINRVFTAATHFHTKSFQPGRILSLAIEVEENQMRRVPFKASKLMSQVWRRNA